MARSRSPEQRNWPEDPLSPPLHSSPVKGAKRRAQRANFLTGLLPFGAMAGTQVSDVRRTASGARERSSDGMRPAGQGSPFGLTPRTTNEVDEAPFAIGGADKDGSSVIP